MKEERDAAVRNLEIIGEATKNISKEFREEHPHVPRKKMAADNTSRLLQPSL